MYRQMVLTNFKRFSFYDPSTQLKCNSVKKPNCPAEFNSYFLKNNFLSTENKLSL